VYSLHSPLTLDFYDDFGNHTGISTSTGQVEEQIPGTYFMEFGGDKYIFTDTDVPIHIFMNGYADGTFTFNVDEFVGDTEIASTTFQDIPTTPTTKVSLGATGDITTLTAMSIDADGDGQTDITLVPKLGQIVTYSPPVPEVANGNASTEGNFGIGTASNGPPIGLINAPIIFATTSPVFTATSTPEISSSATTSAPTFEPPFSSPTISVQNSTTSVMLPTNPAPTENLSTSSPETGAVILASSSASRGGAFKFFGEIFVCLMTFIILFIIIKNI
jgi:hypothetical protein